MTLAFFVLFIFQMISSSNQQYSSSNPKYEKMLNWGKENGLYIGDIDLNYYNSNDKHYIAKEDLAEGQRILSIPKKLFFNRNVTLSKTLNNYKEKILNSNLTIFKTLLAKEQVFDAVHLIKLMKNPISKVYKFFEPYFDFFPNDLSNFPLLYDPEELQILKFSFFIDLIKFSRFNIGDELSFFRNELNLDLNFDEYSFYRALSVSVSFNIDGVNTLIPFSDLFVHHSKNFNVKWDYDIENEVVNIDTIKPINKGDVIIMGNRQMSNSLLLFFYGYTEEGNDFFEDFQVDILHPWIRHQKNFTYTFYKQRMNLANDSFIEENIEIYELISKYYEYKQEKFGGYKIMLENLNHYAEDYEQIKESDFYNVIINKKNRENIRRIIHAEKAFLNFRINQLKDYIHMLEENDDKKYDL